MMEENLMSKSKCAGRRVFSMLALPLLVVACTAAKPKPLVSFEWVDEWGRRGTAVRERDLQLCTERVKSTGEELTICMAQKGWRLRM